MLCVCFGELATRFDQFDKYINISLLSASFEQSFLYIYVHWSHRLNAVLQEF